MTRLLFKNGHVLAGDTVLCGAMLVLEGATIRTLASPAAGESADRTFDLAGGWLLPGFIDTQVNGGGGVLFNDTLTVEGLATIGAAHARFGTTGFLPTLISDTPATIAAALDVVDAAIAAGVPGVVGVHIEGPFINVARKGIHSPDHIRRLDAGVMEVLCRRRHSIVMVTLAPECVEVGDVRRLAAAGVILSAGHSDASYEQAAAGFFEGITGVTHLFNAMSPLQHRAPGLVGAALDSEAIWCGLIADGIHVAAPALRLALKVKGADRIMLVSDAMPGVGHPENSFQLNGRTIGIVDNCCVDANGTLAGAHLDMAGAVREMVRATGATIPEASRMASATAAAFLGLHRERGRLAPGYRADFVVLDANLHAVETWIGGVSRAGVVTAIGAELPAEVPWPN